MIAEQREFELPAPLGEVTRIALQFAQWKETPGGKHILKRIYAKAAYYARRHQRTGRRVSIKLLFELERDQIPATRRWLRDRRGVTLEKSYGFTLNNSYTSHIARHIIDHRPDWDGMFELRELRAG